MRLGVKYDQRQILVMFVGELTVEAIKAKIAGKLRISPDIQVEYYLMFQGMELEFDEDCITLMLEGQDWQMVVKDLNPLSPVPLLSECSIESGPSCSSPQMDCSMSTMSTLSTVADVDTESLSNYGSPVHGAASACRTSASSSARRRLPSDEWPKEVPHYAIRQDVIKKLESGLSLKSCWKHVNEAWYLDASKRTHLKKL